MVDSVCCWIWALSSMITVIENIAVDNFIESTMSFSVCKLALLEKVFQLKEASNSNGELKLNTQRRTFLYINYILRRKKKQWKINQFAIWFCEMKLSKYSTKAKHENMNRTSSCGTSESEKLFIEMLTRFLTITTQVTMAQM